MWRVCSEEGWRGEKKEEEKANDVQRRGLFDKVCKEEGSRLDDDDELSL